jgi:hypothetical protein
MDAYDRLKKIAVEGFEEYSKTRMDLYHELRWMWKTIEVIDQVRALAAEGRVAEKRKCALMLEDFYDWAAVWDEHDMKEIRVLVDELIA